VGLPRVSGRVNLDDARHGGQDWLGRATGPFVFALALAVGTASPGLAARELPTLVVEAPKAMSALAARVRAFDRGRLAVAMELTGLSDPGGPILLVLAPEGSQAARAAPGWAAGWADGRAGVAVVLPARVPAYPYDSLEAVIQHEVAHVLAARAAGGRPLPRWFDEGLAMAAARAWTLEDRTHLVWGVVTGGPETLRALDSFFASAAAGDAEAAYALSAALVREIQSRAGPGATGAILARVARGEEFEAAFAAVVGEPLRDFARRFFRRQNLWNRWVPLVTSSAVLWVGITLLALVAFRRRRRRDAELARRWEEEEEERLWRVRVQGGGPPPPDELVN
jgi:hypothetical protein